MLPRLGEPEGIEQREEEKEEDKWQKIGKIIRRAQIRVAYEPLHTIRHAITKLKDKIPFGDRSDVVYHSACECGTAYVGGKQEGI